MVVVPDADEPVGLRTGVGPCVPVAQHQDPAPHHLRPASSGQFRRSQPDRRRRRVLNGQPSDLLAELTDGTNGQRWAAHFIRAEQR
jgi:hypothetical protein